jgi:hypothetical protein
VTTDPVKATEAVGSLLLRLVTIRYRRRRELFSEVLAPIYQEFLPIHAHYTALLDKYKVLLPLHRREADGVIVWTVSQTGAERRLTRFEERAALSDIIAEAKHSSELTAPIRKLFRTRIGDLLKLVSYEPERRYLFALLAYFSNGVHADINYWDFRSTHAISATIDRLLSSTVTADAFIELTEVTSIGESLEDLLLETPEYETPHRYVSAAHHWIDEAFVHVGREFQRVKVEVIKATAL